MSELEDVQANLKDVQAELTHTRDLYMRLLMNRARDERAARTAMRRETWEQVLNGYDRYIRARAKEELLRLVGRIEMLPEKPTRKQLDGLRWAAELTKHDLESIEDETTNAAVEELKRLRAKVREQAHRIATGEHDGEYCECPACELIRACDDVPCSPADTEG